MCGIGRFPESVVGTWATGSEACKADTKSAFTLSATAYENPDARCTVDWVTERIGKCEWPRLLPLMRNAPNHRSLLQKTISNLMVRPKDNSQISIGS